MYIVLTALILVVLLVLGVGAYGVWQERDYPEARRRKPRAMQ